MRSDGRSFGGRLEGFEVPSRRLITWRDLEGSIPAPGCFLLFPPAEIQSTKLVVDVGPQLGSQLHGAPKGVEGFGESTGSEMKVAQVLGQLRKVRRMLEAVLHGTQGIVEVAVAR